MSFFRMFVLGVLIWFAPEVGRAQTLADLLTSLQDRKQVIGQKVFVHQSLLNLYETSPPPSGEAELFDWGYELDARPEQEDLEALTLEQRIALLNRAVAEFEALKFEYLNVRAGDFETGLEVGAFRRYLADDFPPLPRASPENFNPLLAQLALRVRSLRVLPWTFAANIATRYFSSDFTSPPSVIGPTQADVPYFNWKVGLEWVERASYLCTAEGSDVHAHFLVDVATNADLRWGVAGQDIPGNVALLRRADWTPCAPAAVTPETWNSARASYRVVARGANAQPAVEAPTAITLSGSWVVNGNSPGTKSFVPSGYIARAQYIQDGNDDIYKFSHESTIHSPITHTLYAAFIPDFNRGVDAAATVQALDQAAKTMAAPGADGSLILHPAPSLLYGIDMGCGLDSRGSGMIAVSVSRTNESGMDGFVDKVPFSGRGLLDLLYPAVPNYDGSYLDGRIGPQRRFRFDFASHVRFAGSAEDFHVVYEPLRSERGAALPTFGVVDRIQTGVIDNQSLLLSWDMPRLKQVVGRELIANIKHTGHFSYEIRIYRRPGGVGTIDRTPGRVEPVDESCLVRTYLVKNPDAGEQNFPDTPEKLEITEDETVEYTVVRSTLDDTGDVINFTRGPVSGEVEFRKVITNSEPNESEDPENPEDPESPEEPEEPEGPKVEVFVDRKSTGLRTFSADWDWWNHRFPSSVILSTAETTVNYSAEPDSSLAGTQFGRFPKTLKVTSPVFPLIDQTWSDSGVLTTSSDGIWSQTTTPSAQEFATVFNLNDHPYAKTWTTMEEDGRVLKILSAPDGSTGRSEANWTKVHYGYAGAGLPGLPRQIDHQNGTGAVYEWTTGEGGAFTCRVDRGVVTGSSVTHGVRSKTAVGEAGYTTNTDGFVLIGGQALKMSGTVFSSGTPGESGPPGWGAPEEASQFPSGYESSWAFDGQRQRLKTAKDIFGNETKYNTYDSLERLTEYAWNPDGAGGTGTGSITHNGGTDFGSSSSINIGGRSHSSGVHLDPLGRLRSATASVEGVTRELEVTRDDSTSKVLETSDSLSGAESRSTIHVADGTVERQEDDVLPFEGTKELALTVDGGLLKSTVEVAKLDGAYRTVWTDAWGRTRKVESPSTSGSGVEITTITYSNPAPGVAKTKIVDGAQRHFVNEVDLASFTVRSGLDTDKNGSLGGSDRFTESVTEISNSELKTTVTANGIATPLAVVKYNPADGKSSTALNGGEESVEEKPNFGAKTTEILHKRGTAVLSDTDVTLNNLGQVDHAKVAGAGLATHELDPTYRADGSLDKLGFSVGGADGEVRFNGNGTISGMKHPVLRELAVSHTFGSGKETLTVNGITTTRSLDGTETSITGDPVMGYTSDKVTAGTTGFERELKPVTGGVTTMTANAAGAQTSHNYTAGPGRTMTWYPGGLPKTSSLGRGGSVQFGYSSNGARDLTSITWPQVSSGQLTAPAGGVGYGYNIAGRVSSVSDASGSRTLSYDKNRLEQSEWTSGALRGYRVVRVYDGGVFSGVQLFKDGSATPVHEISYVHTGASDEISGVVASGFAADIFRREEGAPVDRPDRAIMKITRGTVDQLWKRGIAGRIVEASSDVAGAPSFDYVPGSATEANCFDGRGRRLKCTTGGGTWTYAYGTAGQLTSAVRDPASGTFNYNFDGIGRRSGGTDSLNQFTSAVHTTPKKLQVSVAPGASLFVNGQSKTLVDGKYTHVFPAPGATGVWEPWHVLGVLPGEGEQGAGPDAKAEQRGYVWNPPSTENFQYDGDGNRRSSSQWDYGWDALNRLVRARTKYYAGSPEGWDLAFSYDSEGRRFKKTVKHKTRNAANQPVETYKEVLFVWDGWDLIYERHDDGLRNQLLLERKYVWGPDIGGQPFSAGGAGGLLLMRETKRGGTSTDYYPLYDGSGHVTGLATAGGALAASYAYGPFGEQISATGPMASANPWRYATKYYDTETGLYYFGHRYYDASSGQWLSREPLGEGESLNLYAYCHNDPVNRVDVLGLQAIRYDPGMSDEQVLDLWNRNLLDGNPGTVARVDRILHPEKYTAEGLLLQYQVQIAEKRLAYLQQIEANKKIPVIEEAGLGDMTAVFVPELWGFLASDTAFTLMGNALPENSSNEMLLITRFLASAKNPLRLAKAIERSTRVNPRPLNQTVGSSSSGGAAMMLEYRAAGNATGTQLVLHQDQIIINSYQRYYNDAWLKVVGDFNAGKISIPTGMSWRAILGQRTDAIARSRLRNFLAREGISEGHGTDVLVNRWLRDPSGSGAYRIPDVQLKQTGTILDGTIGTKTPLSPQIQDFINFSGGSDVIIIRPQVGPGFFKK